MAFLPEIGTVIQARKAGPGKQEGDRLGAHSVPGHLLSHGASPFRRFPAVIECLDVLEYKALNRESQWGKRTKYHWNFRRFFLPSAQTDGLTGISPGDILLQYFLSGRRALRRREYGIPFWETLLRGGLRRKAAKEQSNTGDTADRSREVSPLMREGFLTPLGPSYRTGAAGCDPGCRRFVFRKGPRPSESPPPALPLRRRKEAGSFPAAGAA